MTAAAETRPFQAETKQLLDLMIHSLYSNKEIFLRELVSNASDALDKLRFESLQNSELAYSDSDLQIRLELDKHARTLTLHDNGIGMSRDEVIQNIGTIARSGTRELWERLSAGANKELPGELIGQFGVGFYSSFMVADRVTLVTRRAGQTDATRWESTGQGDYTLEPATRDSPGTSVTLHLLPADEDRQLDDFSDPAVVRQVIKRYSDFVRYPIVLEGQTLNSMKALWRKRKGEVTEDEYGEFYKLVTHDWEPPLKAIPVHAEGRLEYHALLFIPRQAPPSLLYPDLKAGLQLYVKNVKIMEHCEELLPRYLRFVRGVVDSSDLPLNVSREILQHHGQIGLLRKGLAKKLIDALGELQDNNPEAYRAFWREFGNFLKEGIASPEETPDKIEDLLLFASSADPEALTTLRQYVERMPADQDAIFYLTGESRLVVENSPHLEAFKARGVEVLYLLDPIDELLVQSLTEYSGKPLRSAAKGTVDLGSKAEKDQAEKQRQAQEREYSGVLLRLQKKLDAHIKEVRLSSRLTDSPVCLVSAEQDISPQLQRLLAQGNVKVPQQKRILEINPDHAICRHMKALYSKNSSDPLLDDFAELLFGQALLAEGALPPNPAQFTRLVSDMMVRSALV
jgi:molecular chaperone HtpG